MRIVGALQEARDFYLILEEGKWMQEGCSLKCAKGNLLSCRMEKVLRLGNAK